MVWSICGIGVMTAQVNQAKHSFLWLEDAQSQDFPQLDGDTGPLMWQ